MNKPYVTRGVRNSIPGEFSTIELPNGIIETCFFPDDDTAPSVVIGRTVARTLIGIQKDHIQLDRK